ncbi:MAG: hypothetical protein ASARMPREDX12_006427 [Alectoria sarmentosa]|nr:MAG: hypothetical protein ASARMPREDX12_006427 [Alectoria sarmentosa]
MLLRDVLESPAIAYYPTSVVIGDCVDKMCDWPDWYKERREEGKTEISDAIAQCTDMLSARLDGCPYIRKSNTKDWKLEICAGNEYTAFAFLVTLFPNLESITISDTSSCLDRLVEIVSRIAAAHRKFPESFHPLEKLTTLRLERCSEIFEAWFDHLKPFTELQSLRVLAGKMVLGYECDWGNEVESESESESDDEDEDESDNADEEGLEDENGKANKDDGQDEDESEDEYEYNIIESGGGITCLSFEDSAIDAQSFDSVLRGTKALRSFNYNYAFRLFTNTTLQWEPAAILRILLLYAGHSLVSLDLTGAKGSWDICVGDSPYFINSLRHFQVLNRLCVQDGIFVQSPDSTLYRMVDILPASLEELTLFPSFDVGDVMKRVFEDFLELKDKRLPRLKNITLEGGLQLDESVKLACKKVDTCVVELIENDLEERARSLKSG